MAERSRPGGLTALAVINFVFGGFSALGALGMFAILTILKIAGDAAAEQGEQDEEMRQLAEAWEEIGLGLFYLMLALLVVQAILLIASGVGYLQQKKFLGRTLGNAYAAIAIISSLLFAVSLTDEVGGGFNLNTIVGLIYPALTLFLLNGTFKEDFVR
jgi:hypothetical protein